MSQGDGKPADLPSSVGPPGSVQCVLGRRLAIVITLLVLELPVPPVDAPILKTLSEDWPDFLGYLISFAFIGGVWIAHSRLTRVMKAADTVAYSANLLMLLFVGMLPFATTVMVTHLSRPDMKAAVVMYGLNVLLASVTLSLLMIYVAREPRLLVDDVADDFLRIITRQRWVSIGVNCIRRGHGVGRAVRRCRALPRADPAALARAARGTSPAPEVGDRGSLERAR